MEVDRASREDVFEASRMPTIEELLREKRLRWFGHLMREDDERLSKYYRAVRAVDVRLGLKERYSKKGSIFGVRQINLENVEFCEV